MTPTEELGRMLCHGSLAIAAMNGYIFAGSGLSPLYRLANELQKHLDAADVAPDKRAFGQARIDALRAALARVDGMTEEQRELDRLAMRAFPAYQLGPKAYTDPNPATLGPTGHCTR